MPMSRTFNCCAPPFGIFRLSLLFFSFLAGELIPLPLPSLLPHLLGQPDDSLPPALANGRLLSLLHLG